MTTSRTGRAKRDRISVDIVPEQSSDTTLQCPDLQRLFEDYDEAERCIWTNPEGLDDDLDDEDENKVNAALMRELADWLELNERDYHPGFSVRITSKINAQATACPANGNSAAFDTLLHYIAVQLLASCYTILPASSAQNLPFYQQRRRPTLVTSLRFHSWYRFSPAGGHHARENSESTSWPGLYNGMPLEDRLAECASRRRLLAKDPSHQTWPNVESRSSMLGESAPEASLDEHVFEESHIAGAQTLIGQRAFSREPARQAAWSDGPWSANTSGRSSYSSGSSSSSTSRQGLLTKLMCQRKRKKHRAFFSQLPSLHRSGSTQQQHSNPSNPSSSPSRRSLLQSRTSITVPQMPPRLQLRRTQSVPRKPSYGPPDLSALDKRRNSSNRAFPSQTFQIPEIRRISATAVGQNSNILFERGEPITAEDYLDESRLSPEGNYSSTQLSSSHSGVQFSPPISPMCSTDTLPGRPGSPMPNYRGYFGPMAFAPQEETFEDKDIKAEERRRRIDMNYYTMNGSGGPQASGHQQAEERRRRIVMDHYRINESGGHQQEGSESSDSVDFTEKRRNMVFESGDFGELAFHDLRKSGTF